MPLELRVLKGRRRDFTTNRSLYTCSPCIYMSHALGLSPREWPTDLDPVSVSYTSANLRCALRNAIRQPRSVGRWRKKVKSSTDLFGVFSGWTLRRKPVRYTGEDQYRRTSRAVDMVPLLPLYKLPFPRSAGPALQTRTTCNLRPHSGPLANTLHTIVTTLIRSKA